MAEKGKWFKTPEEIKIHTYCIGGNEDKFIVRFLNNMKEAGCESLSILCTKSEDGMWEHLVQIKETDEYWRERLIIKYQEIKPWRFDVARNESIKLIPEDADYWYCIDEDEMLTPGFFSQVKKRIFELGYIPKRMYYKYAWSHLPDGTPDRVFPYDKLSSPHHIWRYPVHEALILDPAYEDVYGPPVNIDDMETIWLHHWPDPTKSRGSYLGLLRLRAEEYPDDLYGLFYLAREENFAGNHDKSMAVFNSLFERLNRPGVNDDYMMRPTTALALAEEYSKLHMVPEAEFYFKRAIELDEHIIDSYVRYSQWLAYQGRPGDALSVLQKGKKNGRLHQDWRTLPWLNTHWKHAQIVADCLCWLEQYEAAWAVISQAYDEVKDTGEENNAMSEGFFNDYEFIKEKVGK